MEIRDRNSQAVIASGNIEDGSIIKLEGCWYFLPENVDMTHLVITERTYTCPYKGVCYWIDLESPETKAKNVAFIYRNPQNGYEHIKDRIAFYGRDTSGTLAVRDVRERTKA